MSPGYTYQYPITFLFLAKHQFYGHRKMTDAPVNYYYLCSRDTGRSALAVSIVFLFLFSRKKEREEGYPLSRRDHNRIVSPLSACEAGNVSASRPTMLKNLLKLKLLEYKLQALNTLIKELRQDIVELRQERQKVADQIEKIVVKRDVL